LDFIPTNVANAENADAIIAAAEVPAADQSRLSAFFALVTRRCRFSALRVTPLSRSNSVAFEAKRTSGRVL
jgi:hypothetical protein